MVVSIPLHFQIPMGFTETASRTRFCPCQFHASFRRVSDRSFSRKAWNSKFYTNITDASQVKLELVVSFIKTFYFISVKQWRQNRKKINVALYFINLRRIFSRLKVNCELCYCKIRSLRMRSISCWTRPHVFTSFARMKKKFNKKSHWLQVFANKLLGN